MQVIEYIREHGFDKLKEEFGIKVKAYKSDDGYDPLVVLDYCQINSPKTHPIVMECRGLTLNYNTLEVVARGFDRFFNLGEALNVMPEIDWSRATLFEKVDGSFIKIYHFADKWHVATRGTAFAESDCMGFGITFRELVLKALGVNTDEEFQNMINNQFGFNKKFTHLFELTSVENRVVKHYHGYNLYYLGSRDNETGCVYSPEDVIYNYDYQEGSFHQAVKLPKMYYFDSVEECMKTVRELKDLDEGYVVYQDGVPVAKVKSPAYVAVHHIRGEGLNPKRMSELVLSGEVDEYLSYFPEDESTLQPYITAYNHLIGNMVYSEKAFIERELETQKEFAKAVEGLSFKSVLFAARSKDISVVDAFHQQRLSYKIELLKGYVE